MSFTNTNTILLAPSILAHLFKETEGNLTNIWNSPDVANPIGSTLFINCKKCGLAKMDLYITDQLDDLLDQIIEKHRHEWKPNTPKGKVYPEEWIEN